MWHVWLTQGCQYPPRLQILRIDREGMIDDVITHGTWRHYFVQKHTGWLQSSQVCDDTKRVKKMLLALSYLSWLVYFLPSTLLLQMHAWVYQETFDVNIKIAQTMQNISNLACRQRSYSQGIKMKIMLLSESQVYWRNVWAAITTKNTIMSNSTDRTQMV